jgi:serine/threonine protein kinase
MRTLAEYRSLYALGPRYKEGGFAKVYYKATRRADGLTVALKKPKTGRQAAERLRREIDVQIDLPHPNIMPILDADPDRRWFVMPSAEGNLEDLRAKVDEEEFATLLLEAADALAVAHGKEHVHRDLTPPNILALPGDGGGRKWVIADWGLVTRPYATDSVPLTRAGTPLGTDGYAAPEVMDGHSATPAADVYSLGRIAAWYLTGRRPAPNVPLLPDDDKIRWRTLVRDCTDPDPTRRPDLAAFRVLLNQVFALPPGPSPERAHEIVSRILRGQPVAYSDLFRLASDRPQDADTYIDDFARLPTEVLQEWARRDPEGAAQAACRMCGYLTQDAPWENRDREYAVRPLSFVQEILKELAVLDKPGLVEDVAVCFFEADMKWAWPSQRTWVRGWLSGLHSRCADVIALVMTRDPATAEYYGPLRPRHPGLASLLDRRPAAPPP